jgi:hypothetical protein
MPETDTEKKKASLRGGVADAAIQSPRRQTGLPRRWTPRNDDLAPAAETPLGDLRFRSLLGAEQWSSLTPAIRRRFSKRLAASGTALYVGEITDVRMTRLGWLLAQAARLVGGPLPLSRDVGTPATVTVTEDAASGGQFWTRIYGRGRGFPQVIHSSKRFRGPTGLEEYLGHGLGMALTLDGAGNALHFRSDHYFVQLFGRRLRLPGWLSPGTATISHIDHGGGRFTFRLELRHPHLGLLIRQAVLFHDIESGDRCTEPESRASPPSPSFDRLRMRPSPSQGDLCETGEIFLALRDGCCRSLLSMRKIFESPHPEEPQSGVSKGPTHFRRGLLSRERGFPGVPTRTASPSSPGRGRASS